MKQGKEERRRKASELSDSLEPSEESSQKSASAKITGGTLPYLWDNPELREKEAQCWGGCSWSDSMHFREGAQWQRRPIPARDTRGRSWDAPENQLHRQVTKLGWLKSALKVPFLSQHVFFPSLNHCFTVWDEIIMIKVTNGLKMWKLTHYL